MTRITITMHLMFSSIYRGSREGAYTNQKLDEDFTKVNERRSAVFDLYSLYLFIILPFLTKMAISIYLIEVRCMSVPVSFNINTKTHYTSYTHVWVRPTRFVPKAPNEQPRNIK